MEFLTTTAAPGMIPMRKKGLASHNQQMVFMLAPRVYEAASILNLSVSYCFS